MKIKLQKGLFIGDYPLSQLFGENPDAYAQFGLKGHNGIDYAVPTGTVLTSCLNGTVIENQYDGGGYGNYIKIENDYCGVIYAHMKRLSDYKPGMAVSAGSEIGVSGNTGNSTGPHLHFGVFPKPRDRGNGYAGYIDPLNKDLVEWVDSLSTGSAEIEKLKDQIVKLEKSITTWKEEYNKLEEKNSDITAFANVLAEDMGFVDFEYENDSETLLYQLEVLIEEMATINEAGTKFTLLGKNILVVITPRD